MKAGFFFVKWESLELNVAISRKKSRWSRHYLKRLKVNEKPENLQCVTRQRQQDQPPHCITGVSTDLLFSVHPSAEVTLYTPRGNELDQHQQPKSLYISHAVSNFFGTEIEICAGFGPVGSTEKKIRQIMSNSWGRFFHDFIGKKANLIFSKKIASALKSCIISNL
jgi:hypothetical protein